MSSENKPSEPDYVLGRLRVDRSNWAFFHVEGPRAIIEVSNELGEDTGFRVVVHLADPANKTTEAELLEIAKRLILM